VRRVYLSAAVVLALAIVPSCAQARGGKLVFAGQKSGGSGGLYVVGGDGRGLHRVPNTSSSDSNPAWSPDGRSLAFTRDRPITEDECIAGTGTSTCSEAEVYVIGADGSGARRISDVDFRDPCSSTQMDLAFAWSPDGASVLFGSTRWDGRDISQPGSCNGDQLWSAPAVGGGATQVTRTPGTCQGDTAAAWSTTRRIAFVSIRDCSENVWILDPGGDPRRITANHSDNVFFSNVEFSPKGDRLAVVRGRTVSTGATHYDLYVMRSGGGGSRRVLKDASDPAWGPTGRSIAFFHDDNRHGFGIDRIAPGGGKVRRIASLRRFESFSRLDWVR
jgi:Tol biopolymer transport system component